MSSYNKGSIKNVGTQGHTYALKGTSFEGEQPLLRDQCKDTARRIPGVSRLLVRHATEYSLQHFFQGHDRDSRCILKAAEVIKRAYRDSLRCGMQHSICTIPMAFPIQWTSGISLSVERQYAPIPKFEAQR